MEPPVATGGRVHPFFGSFAQSTVNFCEEDWQILPHVAEFFNVISSVPIVALGVVGLVIGLKRKYPPRLLILSVLLSMIGLGSIFFHSTLTRMGQATDELSMVVFISSLVYTVFVSPTSASPLLAGGLVLYTSALVVAYFVSEASFKIFSLSFIGMCVCVMLKSRSLVLSLRGPTPYDTLFEGKDIKMAQRLVIVASIMSAIAFFCFWIPDNALCSNNGRIIELHAVFHVLIGLSAYIAIVFMTFAYYVSKAREMVRAGSVGMALPGPKVEAETGSHPSGRLETTTLASPRPNTTGEETRHITIYVPSIGGPHQGLLLKNLLPHVNLQARQVEVGVGADGGAVIFKKSA